MKTTSSITDYILLKADTDSDWDNCYFALIRCTAEWKEQMQQRLKSLQLVESGYGFASLNYYDTSVDFYRADEKTQTEINQMLSDKEWTFVELDENEQETFLVPENRLDTYRLSLYRYETAIYTAHGKHSGDEFYTSKFPIKDILNHHQETIKIIQLY